MEVTESYRNAIHPGMSDTLDQYNKSTTPHSRIHGPCYIRLETTNARLLASFIRLIVSSAVRSRTPRYGTLYVVVI